MSSQPPLPSPNGPATEKRSADLGETVRPVPPATSKENGSPSRADLTGTLSQLNVPCAGGAGGAHFGRRKQSHGRTSLRVPAAVGKLRHDGRAVPLRPAALRDDQQAHAGGRLQDGAAARRRHLRHRLVGRRREYERPRRDQVLRARHGTTVADASGRGPAARRPRRRQRHCPPERRCRRRRPALLRHVLRGRRLARPAD